PRVLEKSLTLSSDAGDYFDVHYDESTVFTDGTHRIRLRTPGGTQMLIDAAGATAFWTLPVHSRLPSDAMPGDWEKLAAGEEIYVRGDAASAAEAVRARLIVS